MSTPPTPNSPINFLHDLIRSFQEHSHELDSKNNLKKKIEGYVQVIETKKQENQEILPPNIKYINTKNRTASLCRFICKKICNNWSFCKRSVCCANETVYNISVKDGDNEVGLYGGRIQRDNNNQLTNTSFLLELYNSYGSEYLPIVYVCTIDYIERYFPRELEYWLDWNPSSEEPLDKNKAKFFRALMEDAYTVLHNARLDIMKQDLQRNLDKLNNPSLGESRNLFSPHTSPTFPAISITTQDNIGIRKEERESPPKIGVNLLVHNLHPLDAAAPSPQGSIHKSLEKASSEEDIVVQAPVALAEAELFQAFDSEEDIIIQAPVVLPQGALFQAFDVVPKESPSKISRAVYIGKTAVEFNPNKIIEDLLLMTECTEQQAEKIAKEVTSSLEFPCRRQDIWNEIIKEVYKEGIRIKEAINIELLEEVLRMVEEGECLRFADIPFDRIPVSKFSEFIKAKREESSKKAPLKTAARVAKIASKRLSTPPRAEPILNSTSRFVTADVELVALTKALEKTILTSNARESDV